MFWINKTRAEKAAKIIAGYCDKQLTCDKCRFADENGDCTLREKIPMDWGISKETPACSK